MLSNAKQLDGTHIGLMARFRWRFDKSRVIADISGELREVHHNPEGVTLYLTGPDSNGAKAEFTVPHDTTVALSHRADVEPAVASEGD
ncbi:hypothetical protein [Mycolicibacterium mageritense]|uniref:hypothetical protein n=1 Tax=Mycolicibacterium mageritense TaxID=53462 RepID=UPI001E4969C1|nr:hypothetical protein [Mycolicibacterium mageritense]MCC9181137.1 hypothetical protein [Mycolicibacterium mageritense]